MQVEASHFKAFEPDYKTYIPANALRRMGKVIRMGVAASSMAMQEAGLTQLDAIVTGTGLGCLEDSERFLRSLVEGDEQMLAPTAFIQSTHNTVGAQIALLLKCHAPNFTYVHRGFSFESALLDAQLLLQEGKQHVLVGGIEEHTATYVSMLEQYQRIRSASKDIALWKPNGQGFQLGEGASFFVLGAQQTAASQARLHGVELVYKPKTAEVLQQRLDAFLKYHGLDPDAVLIGFSGDERYDQKLYPLLQHFNSNTITAHFKHLSGEYHTAGAFGTWLGTQVIKQGQLPDQLRCNGVEKQRINTLLLVNGFLGRNFTFTLLSAC